MGWGYFHRCHLPLLCGRFTDLREPDQFGICHWELFESSCSRCSFGSSWRICAYYSYFTPDAAHGISCWVGQSYSCLRAQTGWCRTINRFDSSTPWSLDHSDLRRIIMEEALLQPSVALPGSTSVQVFVYTRLRGYLAIRYKCRLAGGRPNLLSGIWHRTIQQVPKKRSGSWEKAVLRKGFIFSGIILSRSFHGVLRWDKFHLQKDFILCGWVLSWSFHSVVRTFIIWTCYIIAMK